MHTCRSNCNVDYMDVQLQCRPVCPTAMHTCRKRHLIVTHKVARPSGNDFAAKHDVLLAEETDGAEGAVKVVVVNVRRDAVLHIVHIDDGRVWLLVLWQYAPSATHLWFRVYGYFP